MIHLQGKTQQHPRQKWASFCICTVLKCGVDLRPRNDAGTLSGRVTSGSEARRFGMGLPVRRVRRGAATRQPRVQIRTANLYTGRLASAQWRTVPSADASGQAADADRAPPSGLAAIHPGRWDREVMAKAGPEPHAANRLLERDSEKRETVHGWAARKKLLEAATWRLIQGRPIHALD